MYNQMLPFSKWSFMLKYPSDFPLLLICNIHSCWMWIPTITCMKRLKKGDMKGWMYLTKVSSQIQLVIQRFNPLYNAKGSHKARYQLSVTCYIQMFHWEQHLITHAELNINLFLIIIIFLLGLLLDLLYHILNLRSLWFSSLNWDANLQPNQLKLAIPNQTPAVMGFVYCYLANLH